MPFDANKLYCSEVLAILLQDNDGELPPIEPGLGCILTAGELGLRHRLDSPLALCAAFVLCQAVLILLADGSVVTVLKSDSWLHFFFLRLFSSFRKQGAAGGAGWDRCASAAVIRE